MSFEYSFRPLFSDPAPLLGTDPAPCGYAACTSEAAIFPGEPCCTNLLIKLPEPDTLRYHVGCAQHALGVHQGLVGLLLSPVAARLLGHPQRPSTEAYDRALVVEGGEVFEPSPFTGDDPHWTPDDH